MARGLAARGHMVGGVTFSRQYPESLFPGLTQLESGASPDAAPVPRLLDSVDPRTWKKTARHIGDIRPAAMIFPYWMPFFAPAFGYIVRRLQKRHVPSIAVVHNALPHERKPGDARLARYALKRCQGLVVLSDGVRRDLGRIGLSAPTRQVTHPTYDRFGEVISREAARRSLGLPQDVPILLFFGFVRRYKGLHHLLDALPAVKKHLPEARLVVAGEFYDDAAGYRKQIEGLGSLASSVRLDAAYVPNERVRLYFSAADVVVQPYTSATQSGVAQVAVQFGTPLITTSVGGLAEAIPDGVAGLIVPPENPDALAAAIVRYFTEEGLEAKLRSGLESLRGRYGWNPLLEAVEELVALTRSGSAT